MGCHKITNLWCKDAYPCAELCKVVSPSACDLVIQWVPLIIPSIVPEWTQWSPLMWHECRCEDCRICKYCELFPLTYVLYAVMEVSWLPTITNVLTQPGRLTHRTLPMGPSVIANQKDNPVFAFISIQVASCDIVPDLDKYTWQAVAE